jgi:hypothetical protein
LAFIQAYGGTPEVRGLKEQTEGWLGVSLACSELLSLKKAILNKSKFNTSARRKLLHGMTLCREKVCQKGCGIFRMPVKK